MPVQRLAQSSQIGAQRRHGRREPYKWLGAGVITLGMGALLAGGFGLPQADADTGANSSGTSSSMQHVSTSTRATSSGKSHGTAKRHALLASPAASSSPAAQVALGYSRRSSASTAPPPTNAAVTLLAAASLLSAPAPSSPTRISTAAAAKATSTDPFVGVWGDGDGSGAGDIAELSITQVDGTYTVTFLDKPQGFSAVTGVTETSPGTYSSSIVPQDLAEQGFYYFNFAATFTDENTLFISDTAQSPAGGFGSSGEVIRMTKTPSDGGGDSSGGIDIALGIKDVVDFFKDYVPPVEAGIDNALKKIETLLGPASVKGLKYAGTTLNAIISGYDVEHGWAEVQAAKTPSEFLHGALEFAAGASPLIAGAATTLAFGNPILGLTLGGAFGLGIAIVNDATKAMGI
jgi:hypothetical protein